MYDLRIVVEEVRGFCDMPMRPGDYCELRGSRLSIPEGRHFCMWALQSVLPLLPVKQRRIAEENDWIPRTLRVTCPDPDGMVILRIEQIDPRGDEYAAGRGSGAVGPLPRLLVDRRLCTGCRACELACSHHHEGVFAPSVARLRVRKDEAAGVDEPMVCRQCGVARCVEACSHGALSRERRTGAVLLDAGLCVRCGDCVEACPFHAIGVHPDTALPLICDLCGGEPACVARCVTGALRYGRAGDAARSPRMAEERGAAGGEAAAGDGEAAGQQAECDGGAAGRRPG